MSWADDLSRIVSAGIVDLDFAARKIKFDIFSEVIKATRVDEGRLRGNWQISEGKPEEGVIDRKNNIPAGQIPPEQISELTNGVTGDSVTYYVNNLPYAKKYEEEDAMVGRSVAAVRQVVRNVANSVK